MTVPSINAQVSPAIKRMMQTRFAGIDDAAWELGDLAYEIGDTLDIGVAKAAQDGIRPGTNEYAAFLTAFSRRVRLKEVAPQKLSTIQGSALHAGSSVLLPAEYSRL